MALSPGQTIIGLYDYSTTTGAKLYIKSTKALNLIDYGVSPQGLSNFWTDCLEMLTNLVGTTLKLSMAKISTGNMAVSPLLRQESKHKQLPDGHGQAACYQ